MILSTMQPPAVWEAIQATGVYRPEESLMETLPDFKPAYEWMVKQMESRIGPRPDGVQWPVWAWYMNNNRTGHLDLRRSENRCFEPTVCIEIEIPDDQVLLSAFIDWHNVLNDGFCTNDLDEYEALEKLTEVLPIEEAKRIKEETWTRIFDLSPRPEGPVSDIQATFWQLRLEQVRCVRRCQTYKDKGF